MKAIAGLWLPVKTVDASAARLRAKYRVLRRSRELPRLRLTSAEKSARLQSLLGTLPVRYRAALEIAPDRVREEGCSER